MHIVKATATGAWAGKEGHLAYWLTTAGAWQFLTPSEGWEVWSVEDGAKLQFDGSAWAEASSGSSVQSQAIYFPVTALETAPTTGTGKVKFRVPFALTLTDVRASLATAQTSGSILIVDVNQSGTSILSTKLSIDNTEKTSTTASAPVVISSAELLDDAEISIDVDQVGTGGKGLTVCFIGYPSPPPAAEVPPTTIGEAYHGGYYVGDIVDGGDTYAIIMNDTSTASLQMKTASTDTPGTSSTTDGPANTAAILAAGGSALATALDAYNVGGTYHDWYMPSIDELTLAWTNRVALAGAITFTSTFYFSSTQTSGTPANQDQFYFDGGYATNEDKSNWRPGIPVRRILK